MTTFIKRNPFLYLTLFIVSLFISTWAAYQETVINSDAICYLLSAEYIGEAGLKSAMSLCDQAKWPFYSFLIYKLASFTQYPYQYAAYAINALFSAASVVLFTLIIKNLGGSKRVMWLAAAVILCAHYFMSVREYIIRDHGYWAFYLLSIYILIRYFQFPTLLKATAWTISLIVAALFRIEAVLFLLFVPFAAWTYYYYPREERVKAFIYLYLPTIFLSVLLIGWLVLHPDQGVKQFGRLSEVTNQFQHGLALLSERFLYVKGQVAKYVLTSDSTQYAGPILVFVLIAWYLFSVIGNVTWVYAALVAYAWKNKICPKQNFMVPIAYLLTNVLITAVFLAERLFLSKRYLIALSLVLMLWVPFALNDLIKKSNLLRNKVILVAIALLMLSNGIGGIVDFGYSKEYVHKAGDWLAENVPTDSSLYANDLPLMYYSKHFGYSVFSTHLTNSKNNKPDFSSYNYLALKVSGKDANAPLMLQNEVQQPIKVFSNKRGDRVVIYKLPNVRV